MLDSPPPHSKESSPILTLLVVVALNLCLVTTAHAADYYVATTGNDSNAGSEAAPFKTIAYAVSRLSEGDTVYVHGGVYNETRNIHIKKSNTKLLGVVGELPVIDCSSTNYAYHGVFVESTGRMTHADGDITEVPMGDITIEGFEIRNCLNGMRLNSVFNVVIQGNWIHHSKANGILGNMRNVFINRNRITHNGHFAGCAADIAAGVTGGNEYSCNKDHGMYITGSNYVITNNLVYDNLSNGIQVAGYPWFMELYGGAGPDGKHGKRGAHESFAGASGWLIANNTIAYQHYGPAVVLWQQWATNNKIINNIFYENGTKMPGSSTNGVSFVSLGSEGTGHVINNNLFYESGAGAKRMFGPNGTEGVHYTQSGNFTAEPQFLGAASTFSGSPDFKLQASSPAIDKGITLSQVTGDYQAGARPVGAGYDIGAFEHGSTPGTAGTPPLFPPDSGGGFILGPPILKGPNGEVCPSGF